MSKDKFAVLETGGKQYLVREGDVISIEKLDEKSGEKVKFNNILLYDDSKETKLGTPYLNVEVSGEIISEEKDKKVRVFKFKKKTGYKKTQGHRQKYSTIKIDKITETKSSSKKAAASKKTAEASGEENK